jgi:hypothetical protein
VTIACFVLCIILVSSELLEYWAYSVQKGFVVDHKLENNDVEVHLDIVFRRMPCHLLGLDVVDYIGTHSMNLHEKIKKFSVDMDGRTVQEMPYSAVIFLHSQPLARKRTPQRIQKSLERQNGMPPEGCL